MWSRRKVFWQQFKPEPLSNKRRRHNRGMKKQLTLEPWRGASNLRWDIFYFWKMQNNYITVSQNTGTVQIGLCTQTEPCHFHNLGGADRAGTGNKSKKYVNTTGTWLLNSQVLASFLYFLKPEPMQLKWMTHKAEYRYRTLQTLMLGGKFMKVTIKNTAPGMYLTPPTHNKNK